MPIEAAHRKSAFAPEDVTVLVSAFGAVLSELAGVPAQDESATPRDLRRRVAAAILAEARTGTMDPVKLKEAALRSLSDLPIRAEPFAAPRPSFTPDALPTT